MKFDMHCHTAEGSIDARISIRDYAQLLKDQGFSGMLVTDHDSNNGYRYWKLHRASMPKDFLVLKGIEYDTRDAGHYIVIMPDGVNLRLLEMRGMSVESLIRLVHDYGGVLGPAHPFGMKSSSAMFYRKMMRDTDLMSHFDFLEGLNACEKASSNSRARDLAEQYDLPCIGGTDAHVGKYVGLAYTIFDRDITCNNDMIESIRERGIVAFGGREREYRRIHEKRNLAVTTWSFKAFNFTMGKILAPVRNHRLNQALEDKKNLLQAAVVQAGHRREKAEHAAPPAERSGISAITDHVGQRE